MDEKKNVGFVPGLALILAVLALVMIAINGVKPTPTEEAMEQAINMKIEGLANSIVNEIRNSDEISKNVTTSLLKRDMDNLTASLNVFSGGANPELAPDILALQNAIKSLQEKLNAGPAPTAPAAAPTPAPAE